MVAARNAAADAVLGQQFGGASRVLHHGNVFKHQVVARQVGLERLRQRIKAGGVKPCIQQFFLELVVQGLFGDLHRRQIFQDIGGCQLRRATATGRHCYVRCNFVSERGQINRIKLAVGGGRNNLAHQH